jgi:hypothetical protein
VEAERHRPCARGEQSFSALEARRHLFRPYAEGLLVFAPEEGEVAENKLIVIDNLNLAEPKTKLMSALLENLGVHENALVLIKDENKNLTLAARNIPSVKVLRMGNINVYDVLKYRYLLTTQDALTVMQEVYGK